jgi:PiT family inorganic phosphate transporter
MSPLLLLVILVILLAIAFDYSNGFHDAANSIATIVATRVLRPFQAVLWAAFFNFVAAFTFDVAVAKTIGKGIIQPEVADVYVILSCLVGAIGWNITTWWLGLPTSSSHALVGGLIGAAVVKAGTGGVVVPGIIKTASFIVLSPTIGMLLGMTLMTLALRALQNSPPQPTNLWARRLQLVSSGFYSLGHGMNDAQKTMGIIAVLLISMRDQVPELQTAPAWFMPPQNLEHIPWWIILVAHAAIALGTMSGGWRIVKTMGMRITELQPIGGVCAETAGALTLVGTALAGIPVSTTHTITGSIVGVGASRRLSAVRWGVAGTIVWAWILTIPAAALMSAATYVLVAMVWPRLPFIGQAAAGLIIAFLLGYACLAWLRTAVNGKAHAGLGAASGG